MSIEIGNGEIKAASCLCLARLLTDYSENLKAADNEKALEPLGKAFKIDKEIGDRSGEAS